jgi:hypothetical protein
VEGDLDIMGIKYRQGNGRMVGNLREGRKIVLEAKVHSGLTVEEEEENKNKKRKIKREEEEEEEEEEVQ